jgi:hypothetical protein
MEHLNPIPSLLRPKIHISASRRKHTCPTNIVIETEFIFRITPDCERDSILLYW